MYHKETSDILNCRTTDLDLDFKTYVPWRENTAYKPYIPIQFRNLRPIGRQNSISLPVRTIRALVSIYLRVIWEHLRTAKRSAIRSTDVEFHRLTFFYQKSKGHFDHTRLHQPFHSRDIEQERLWKFIETRPFSYGFWKLTQSLENRLKTHNNYHFRNFVSLSCRTLSAFPMNFSICFLCTLWL